MRRVCTISAAYGEKPVLSTGGWIEERHVASGPLDTMFSGFDGGGGEMMVDQDSGMEERHCHYAWAQAMD
jgi:hypothetical protein